MFFFKRTGGQVIRQVLATFEKMAAEIERGIALNQSEREANGQRADQLVAAAASLYGRNEAIAKESATAEQVVKRLRDLVS